MPIINQGKASFSSFGASGECTISISPLLLLRICSLHAFSYSTKFHHTPSPTVLLERFYCLTQCLLRKDLGCSKPAVPLTSACSTCQREKSLGRSKPATNS